MNIAYAALLTTTIFTLVMSFGIRFYAFTLSYREQEAFTRLYSTILWRMTLVGLAATVLAVSLKISQLLFL